MRIISGTFKGRRICMPKGIRPTQEKVREAFFDILGDVEGLSFLDLFAGSGAMGFEALSRGAREVALVENNQNCLKAIKKNVFSLGITNCALYPYNVLKAIERFNKDKKRFDIVFLDPPYYLGLVKKTLQTLGAYDIVAPNGFIVVQHFKKDILPDKTGRLVLFKQATYGDTVLTFYKEGIRNQ